MGGGLERPGGAQGRRAGGGCLSGYPGGLGTCASRSRSRGGAHGCHPLPACSRFTSRASLSSSHPYRRLAVPRARRLKRRYGS